MRSAAVIAAWVFSGACLSGRVVAGWGTIVTGAAGAMGAWARRAAGLSHRALTRMARFIVPWRMGYGWGVTSRGTRTPPGMFRWAGMGRRPWSPGCVAF